MSSTHRSLWRLSIHSRPCLTSSPFSSITPHQASASVASYRVRRPRTPAIVPSAHAPLLQRCRVVPERGGPVRYRVIFKRRNACHLSTPYDGDEDDRGSCVGWLIRPYNVGQYYVQLVEWLLLCRCPYYREMFRRVLIIRSVSAADIGGYGGRFLP